MLFPSEITVHDALRDFRQFQPDSSSLEFCAFIASTRAVIWAASRGELELNGTDADTESAKEVSALVLKLSGHK